MSADHGLGAEDRVPSGREIQLRLGRLEARILELENPGRFRAGWPLRDPEMAKRVAAESLRLKTMMEAYLNQERPLSNAGIWPEGMRESLSGILDKLPETDAGEPRTGNDTTPICGNGESEKGNIYGLTPLMGACNHCHSYHSTSVDCPPSRDYALEYDWS